MNRRDFVKTTALAGTGLALANNSFADVHAKAPAPLAITMWDFSWLERRWEGAGYEDWDKALSELVARGYNAVRIDAYPHLISTDPEKEYLLHPCWNTQCWGSPALNKVKVQPNFIHFIKKCKEYNVKVALSSWWRQDDDKSYLKIKSPEILAEVWLSVLNLVAKNNLLDQILYLDLSNEWPLFVWTPFNTTIGGGDSAESIHWMKISVDILRKQYPQIPYTFSSTGEMTKGMLDKGDYSMLDFLEPHIWMTSGNNDEFYETVGYHYEPFADTGYKNMVLKAKKLYREKENYWKESLVRQIEIAAEWSRKLQKPLITTECWGVVDYKDWPLLEWDWVKELCELGTKEAAKTGRWAAIATSNFCGPQFAGMWNDRGWHTNLTNVIKRSTLDEKLQASLLLKRI